MKGSGMSSKTGEIGQAKLVGYDRRDFYKRLRLLLKIVVPSPMSKEAALLAIHTVALVFRTILSLYMAALDGQLVKTIVERDLPGFLRAMFKWFTVGIPATITTAMIKFTESKIALAFRTRLTNYMVTRYMTAQTFYRVSNLDGRLTTVDQALTEDVMIFSKQLAHLYSQMTKPTLDVVLYTTQLIVEGAKRFGYLAPVLPTMMAFGVVFITAQVLRLVAPSFARRVAYQAQLDGELRFFHSRLAQNAEEIAFYRGEEVERSVLDSAYTRLAKELNRFYRRCVPYNIMEGYMMKYMWGGTGMAMIGVPQFLIEIAAGVVAALGKPQDKVGISDGSVWAVGKAFLGAALGRSDWLERAIDVDAPGKGDAAAAAIRAASRAASTEAPSDQRKVIGQSIGSRTKDYVMFKRLLIDSSDAVERIMLALKDVKELDGRMFRLTQVLDVFADCEKGHYVKECSENKETYDINLRGLVETTDAHDDESAAIRLEGVPIVAPNGDVLLRSLTIDIVPGRNILITGPNGAGKSSFFRVLGDIWPIYGGRLRRPVSNMLFYIPQKPYLPVGSLRDQVIYPHTHTKMKIAGRTDDDLRACLRTVDLEYILDREGGFEAFRTDWKGALSGGEQQRVGLARLFYHRPRFAILDECTASVSIDAEARIFQAAFEHGITLLTVAHRDTLRQYHSHRLALDGAGGYSFGLLDQTVSIASPTASKPPAESAFPVESAVVADAEDATANTPNRRRNKQ